LDIKSVFDFFNPLVILKFRAVIRQHQPEIIATYLIHADLFGRVWGRIFGVRKIICHHRGSLLQWGWLFPLDKVTRFLVTKYVFQTPSAKQSMSSKFGLLPSQTLVIPNAIDLEDFNFSVHKDIKLRELGIRQPALNIVCVANLRRGKGHSFLIEAFSRALERASGKYGNINLLIVGDGDQRQSLTKQAGNSPAKDHIYFLGHRSDTVAILKVCDIFALPTLAEGMSNAIMEAMAAGLPVITTDIDANQDLITDNHSGILVPPANIALLEHALTKLINNPDVRLRLGANAAKLIKQKYSLDQVIPQIHQMLQNI
jgi:glycosyltransferase involved in cell wall biosynthesis